MVKACLFDLDGVLVDTAKYHFTAWQQLAHSLGVEFTHHDNENLKGVSRMESLEYILNKGNVQLTEAEKLELADKKNGWYLASIESINQNELLDGSLELLKILNENNIKVSLGSASKSGEMVLEKLGILPYFQAVVDGNHFSKSKPDPEVFLKGASLLGVDPKDCIVFEDSQSGLQAASAGGMKSIGIGTPDSLGEFTTIVVPSLAHVTLDLLHTL